MISKETGTKIVKVGLLIITPTVILLLVLVFMYWRNKKKEKAEKLKQETVDENGKSDVKNNESGIQ